MFAGSVFGAAERVRQAAIRGAFPAWSSTPRTQLRRRIPIAQ